MNKVRRKALVDIQAKIEEIDELDNALSSLDDAVSSIEEAIEWGRREVEVRVEGVGNENLRNLQILDTGNNGVNSPGESKTPMAALQFKRGNENGGG